MRLANMDAKEGSQETTEGERRRRAIAGKGVGVRGEFVQGRQGALDLVTFSEIGNRKWVHISYASG